MSSYFVGLNRSKRSVVLDLKRDAGKAALLRMVRDCDVLLENFKPGWMEDHGLGPEVLSRANPRLIHCTLTPFGSRGPMSRMPAMDIIAQAAGGVMQLTGPEGGDPVKVGTPIADFTASFLMVMGVLTGLYRRELTGEGATISTSLLAGQIALLPNVLSGYNVTGYPDRAFGSGHPQLVPYQIFHASDGLVVIGCLTEDHWRRLCRLLELDHLIEDTRFRRNIDRVDNREALVEIIEGAIGLKGRDYWLDELNSSGIPAGPVNTMHDVLQSRQVWDNQLVRRIDMTDRDDVVVVGNPLEIAGSLTRPPQMAPALGEHTEEVLREFGLSEDEIRDLR
jgi:crotonobetainyl-CoA:carnitine CoA-transferase CaiB-like acyl-CoA transferase